LYQEVIRNNEESQFPTPRAPGGPGIELRWTHGAKVAVGTAYSTSSRVWYTLDAGCVTEVYYPTIDTPQIRDLQFLFTDGETFFHDERRNFTSEMIASTKQRWGLK
jgi:glucoamylase